MRTETLNVTGMTCGSCTEAVAKALKGTHGVKDVSVTLESGQATVEFDESKASIQRLREAVKQAGYGVADRPNPPQSGGCCCAS